MADPKKSVADLDAEFDSLPSVEELDAEFDKMAGPAEPQAPVPVKYVKSVPTPEEFNEIEVADKGPSKTETFGAGYLKGAALNLDDELYGALSTLGERGRRLIVKMGLRDPETNKYGEVVDPVFTEGVTGDFGAEYARNRDEARAQDAEHEATNPKTFLAGQVAGAVSVPTPKVGVIKDVSKIGGGAARMGARMLNSGVRATPAGAVAGFGNSEADTVTGMAADTAVGAGTAFGAGGLGEAAATGLGKIGSGLRRLADGRAFKALTGESAGEAAKVSGQELADGVRAAGGDVGGDIPKLVVAAEKSRNLTTGRMALDEGVVGPASVLGGAKTMTEKARNVKSKEVQAIADYAKSLDEAVEGAKSYAMDAETTAEAVNRALASIEDDVVDPVLAETNKKITEQIRKYAKSIGTPDEGSPQLGLFDVDGPPAPKATFRQAWQLVLNIRERAAKATNEYEANALNHFAWVLEMDLSRKTLEAAARKQAGPGWGWTPEASKAFRESVATPMRSSDAANRITSALADRTAKEPSLLSSTVTGKILGGLGDRSQAAMAVGLDTAQKTANAGMRGLRTASPKLGQAAGQQAPTWESIKQRLAQDPKSLGPYAKVLGDAAAKGDKQLAFAHYMLSQKDQGYQELLKNSQE